MQGFLYQSWTQCIICIIALSFYQAPEDEEVVIEWIAINKIKEYSTDDIKQLFTEAHENRKYSHKYVTAIN